MGGGGGEGGAEGGGQRFDCQNALAIQDELLLVWWIFQFEEM